MTWFPRLSRSETESSVPAHIGCNGFEGCAEIFVIGPAVLLEQWALDHKSPPGWRMVKVKGPKGQWIRRDFCPACAKRMREEERHGAQS